MVLLTHFRHNSTQRQLNPSLHNGDLAGPLPIRSTSLSKTHSPGAWRSPDEWESLQNAQLTEAENGQQVLSSRLSSSSSCYDMKCTKPWMEALPHTEFKDILNRFENLMGGVSQDSSALEMKRELNYLMLWIIHHLDHPTPIAHQHHEPCPNHAAKDKLLIVHELPGTDLHSQLVHH
jgi:hypothetical protein